MFKKLKDIKVGGYFHKMNIKGDDYIMCVRVLNNAGESIADGNCIPFLYVNKPNIAQSYALKSEEVIEE